MSSRECGSENISAQLDVTSPENVLHTREEWLRLAAQVSQLGLWRWNEITKELFCDAKTRDMLGMSLEGEVTLDDFYGVLHPDDLDRVKNVWRYELEQGLPYELEYRSRRPDGSIRWIHDLGSGYYDSAGKPLSMVGVVFDITERKQAEHEHLVRQQAALEARLRLATIVDSSDDAIISENMHGTIESWNASAERMFGFTAAEAIGQSVEMLAPPEMREEQRASVRRLEVGERITLETIRVTKTGSKLDVSITISPIRNPEGQIVGTSKIIRDITERKRAEEAVKESEIRFRLVADTAPVLIWMSGTDKLCTYFNKPWLDFTGRSREQELGNGWAEGVHPSDLQRCLDTYHQSFDRREKLTMEYRLRHYSGEYHWILDIGVPRFNQGGSFAGYIGCCIDITDRKRAEETLLTVNRRLIEAQEQERARISRELHDDINQRLALFAVELDQWSKENSGANFSEHLGHAQSRIVQISHDVQALSYRLHSSKLDYLGLAAAAGSFCREMSQTNKVEVQFSLSAVPSTIPKDVSLCLFRILQEALQNAIKYSGVRLFRVNLHGTPNGVELTVSDEGNGFDEHDELSRQGLGMISMRERLQLVNGILEITTQPGAGTTISATIPLHMAEIRAMAG